uniref:Uncharacterized protein n=1 Tax=Arundo donax TaxID=35708 RepID=A0A0A9AUR3_ARUDO
MVGSLLSTFQFQEDIWKRLKFCFPME